MVVVTPKSNDPGIRNSTFPSSSSLSVGRAYPLLGPFWPPQQVGVVEGIRNDTRGIIVVIAPGVPFAMSPTKPPQRARSSGDGSDKCCCCPLVSDSGIACHDSGPRLLLCPSSSSKMSASWSFLSLFVPLLFTNCKSARRDDRVMPASPGIKVLTQAAQVMFRRSCEARGPCMRQCFLSGEATFGDGTEGTDEVPGCANVR